MYPIYPMYRRPPPFVVIMTNFRNMSPDSTPRTYNPSEAHMNYDYQESLLEDTLRFQLRHIMRYYLSHTTRTDPIYFLFDMSNLIFRI